MAFDIFKEKTGGMNKKTWRRIGLILFSGVAIGIASGPVGSLSASEETWQASWQKHLALSAASPFRNLRWQSLGPRFQGGRVEAIDAVQGTGASLDHSAINRSQGAISAGLRSYGTTGGYGTVMLATMAFQKKRPKAFFELTFVAGEEGPVDWMEWKIGTTPVTSLEELKAKVSVWQQERNLRVHRTTGRPPPRLISPAGRNRLVDEVRMEIQADSGRVPSPGRKRKFLFFISLSRSLS
jgi:hypothetical protein